MSGRLCAAHSAYGLRVYRVSDTGVLTNVANVDPGGVASRVMVRGDYVFLAARTAGLYVYQLDASDNLTLLDNVNPGGLAEGVWYDGSIVYLASGSAGLYTYSLNEDGELTELDHDDQGGKANKVWGDGTWLYLANDSRGLEVYSVDSDGILSHVDCDDQGSVYVDVWGDGSFIYCAAYSLGLLSYSVNGSGILTHIDTKISGGTVYGVNKLNGYIVAARGGGGVSTLSVDGSGVLSLVDTDDQGGSATGVDCDSEFAFIGNGFRGIEVYTVDSSGTLTHVDNEDPGGDALNVWRMSGASPGGLRFINISGNYVDVALPVFPYRTTIRMPFEIIQREDGRYSSYDHGSSYDIRECDCDLILDATDTQELLDFLRTDGIQDGRGKKLVMTLGSDSGFHPFGPDKSNTGDFTVVVDVLDVSGAVGHQPWLYHKVSLHITNVATYPTYSLPSEITEGLLSIGTVTLCRFPEQFFSPNLRYAYTNTIEANSTERIVDRGSSGDSYTTSAEFLMNESKAAAVIDYLTSTARAGTWSLGTTTNFYPFGRDLGTGTFIVRLINSTITMVCESYNRWRFTLDLGYEAGPA